MLGTMKMKVMKCLLILMFFLMTDEFAEENVFRYSDETDRVHDAQYARQHAYTIGDICQYKVLCDKVSGLISNAKESYYLSNGKGLRVLQPEKWYKTIYGLATINDSLYCIPPAEVTEYLVEQLQQAFIKPCPGVP
jgi:hypothetical protein